MKKLPVVIICGAVAGIAIAPKIIGLSVIETLNARVAQLNEIPAYKASVKEVNSGWFSSSAVIDLSLNFPEMSEEQQKAFTFELNFSAQHGPILLGEQKGIGREAWQISYAGDSLRKQLDFNADQAFYSFNAKTNLLGATIISDHILPFKVQTTENGEQLNISFSGYQGNGDIKRNKVSYVANVDNISAEGSGKLATIENIHFDSQLDASADQIFSGDLYDSLIKLSIANMNFDDSQDESFKSNLKNIVIGGESKTDNANKLIHILTSYSLESYNVMGSEGQDLRLNIDMNNLSSDFIKAYQTQVQEVMQNPQSDPNVVQQQLLDFVNNNLLDLLIASPELNVAQLSGTIGEGKFNAQLFTKLVNITKLPDNMLDNGFWISHIQASTNIEMDQNIAEMVAIQVVKSQLKGNPQLADATPEQLDEIAMQQAPMILQNLEQQGLLEATTTGYRLVAELKDSQASLNGNPIPLPLP
jgi:uncharacterized protein YdgA (DUF945 family)